MSWFLFAVASFSTIVLGIMLKDTCDDVDRYKRYWNEEKGEHDFTRSRLCDRANRAEHYAEELDTKVIDLQHQLNESNLKIVQLNLQLVSYKAVMTYTKKEIENALDSTGN